MAPPGLSAHQRCRNQLEPRLARSEGLSAPEVAGVWRAMAKSGVALFLDLHGDEALPYVFTAGCEGVPGSGMARRGWAYRQQRFRDRLEALNPAYQQRFGIP